MNLNKKYEDLFFPRIKKTIDKVFNDTIRAIEYYGNIQDGINELNKELTNSELATEIKRLYSTVGVRTANNIYRGLKQAERGMKKPIKSFDDIELKAGASFGFNQTWVDWILNYLNRHLFQRVLFDANRTTRDHLLSVLSKSITEGMGIDETVRLLKNDDFSETQAARIARTEVNIASNAGTLAAGETYEYQTQKEWIAVHDFRTRGNNPDDHASHVALNGTVIDFEDVFVDSRNGDRLKSPGDPTASAASIINCRCQMAVKPKEDSNGRLIPKRRSTVVIYPNQIRQGRVVTI